MKNLDEKLIAAAKLARRGYTVTVHECGVYNCYRVARHDDYVGFVQRQEDGEWRASLL